MVKRREEGELLVRKSEKKGRVVPPPAPEDEIAKTGREKAAHRAFSPAPAGEGGRWRGLQPKVSGGFSESKVSEGQVRSENLGRPIFQHHPPPR